jgi:hypothetical protein
MPSKIREFVAKKRKDYLLIFVVFGYVLSLLLANIRSMVPHLKPEDPNALMVLFGQGLIDNVLLIPIRLAQYIMIKFDLSYIDLRFVSVAFGLLACIAMYQLLHKWHTRRVSFGVVILFGSSSLFLATARLASTDVVYFLAIPLLLICGSWLRKKKDINKLPLSVLVTVSLLYLPGMWLFALAGAAALRKRIKAAWQLNPPSTKILSLGTGLLLLSPMAYSFYKTPGQITSWLGLPELGTITLGGLLANFIGIFDGLFWSGLPDRSLWLAGTPILDVFAMAMLVLGLYYYQFGYHPLRKRVLFGFGLAAIVLIALGGPVPIALVLPLAYIFVAAGVALMLQQWFTVFPRNPLARTTGLLLISIAVATSCFYQTQRYFFAWPSNPETTQAIQSESL